MKVNIPAFLSNRGKSRIVFITGAGISAESGLQTFRGGNGFWNNYDLDEVCNISTFFKNYQKVHKFYNKRRKELAKISPNITHQFITEVQQIYGEDRVMVITTNVDDLHEKAGSKVLHVHGILTEMIEPFNWEQYAVKNIGYSKWKPMDGVISKPNVMFFGEQWTYTEGRRRNAYEDMEKIIFNLNEEDIVFIIGCSHTVIDFRNYFSSDKSIYEHCSKVFSVDINNKSTPAHLDFSKSITKSATQSIPDMKEVIHLLFNK